MNSLFILVEYDGFPGVEEELAVFLVVLFTILGILGIFFSCGLISIGVFKQNPFLVILGIGLSGFGIGLIFGLIIRESSRKKVQSEQ